MMIIVVAFFWVIPRRLKNILSPRAEAIFRSKPFHVQYPTFSTAVILHTYPPMKMEQTDCSKTLVFKLQTPENNPEESRRHSKHNEILKSRIMIIRVNTLRLMRCAGHVERTGKIIISNTFNYAI
jgi:hypothetical protein